MKFPERSLIESMTPEDPLYFNQVLNSLHLDEPLPELPPELWLYILSFLSFEKLNSQKLVHALTNSN